MHNRRWVGRNRGKNLKSASSLVQPIRMSNSMLKERFTTGKSSRYRYLSQTPPTGDWLGFYLAYRTAVSRSWDSFRLVILGSLLVSHGGVARGADEAAFGPLFHQFQLTLDSGTRTECLGPFYYQQTLDETATHLVAVPPLFSYSASEDL